MKVVVIGSGSIFFTRRMVLGMAHSPILHNAELVLVDTNEHKCREMGRFCQKINESCGGSIRITWTTDRLEALPGSDYVILSFAIRNYHYRETGTTLSKLYGINVISGETAGPSAVFRILRTVPVILRVAADIERLCPGALVINYVNPTNVIGTALQRFTKLRSYAFCDGMYEIDGPAIAQYLGVPRMSWAELTGRYAMKMGGINHFTFLWELRQGEHDLWQQFRSGLERCAKTEGIQSDRGGEWEFVRTLDAWPTQFYHTAEYVRFFQGKGSQPARDNCCERWSLNKRIRWYRQVWKAIEDCNAGRITVEQAITDQSTDMVAALIESIEGDQGRIFPVNVRNDGRIPNLPSDTMIEVLGAFCRDRVDLAQVGPLPRGLAGLILPSIEEQELALEAAMTGNFRTIVKAVAADPLVMSFRDAEDLAREFMALEENDLDHNLDHYWLNAEP